MRRFLIMFATTATLMGLAQSAAHAGEADTEASRFVESLSHSLVAVLHSAEFDADERAGRLREVLQSKVDLARIGRYVLGEHWDAATPEQRREYQSLFADYALSLVSRTLIEERFRQVAVVGSKPIARSQALVHTRIERDRGEAMQWIWRLRRSSNDRFQAIDLIMNGVSLVRTYRSQIGSVVANLGIDGLIKILRIKSI